MRTDVDLMNMSSTPLKITEHDVPQNLVYVSDDEPGIWRKRKHKGVTYVDNDGSEVMDENTLRRINSLVIPPNWSKTWICKLENGHLQSTGRDERNRKQYLYHEEWVKYRQKSKFSKLIEFGETLPDIRRKINYYLEEEGLSKNKVLATAVKLLDLHYLRIGNDFYLSENETYGLTTLRRKHLEKNQGAIKLSYKAKSNKYRNISIENKKLIRLINEVNELPGYEVFQYKDQGQKKRIDSSDVNAFIKEVSGSSFTAKDFRTWGGTVSALEVLEEAKEEIKQQPRKKLETAVVRRVSKILGNTVATAKAYYIHPKILSAIVKGEVDKYSANLDPSEYSGRYFKKNEALTLSILKES